MKWINEHRSGIMQTLVAILPGGIPVLLLGHAYRWLKNRKKKEMITSI